MLDASLARQKLAFATMMIEAEGTNTTLPKAPIFKAGTDPAGNPILIEWLRFGPQKEPNRFVQPKGAKGSAYLTATNKKNVEREGLLNALAKGPDANAATVSGLQALGAGQQLTAAHGDPKKLAELDVLMHGQEVARHPENLAFGLMARDMIAQDKMDLIAAGAMLPAQPRGALKAQRAMREAAGKGDLNAASGAILSEAEEKAVKQETRGHKNDAKAAARTRKDAEVAAANAGEVAKRSVALMTEWIKAEIAAGKGPVSKDEAKFLRWIRDAIRKRLHKYISEGR